MMFGSNFGSSVTSWFSKFQSGGDDDVENKCKEMKADSGSSAIDVNSDAVAEVNNDTVSNETEDQENTNQGASAMSESFDVQKAVVEETQKIMNSALSFGNYLMDAASETSKKMSDSVNLTALKSTVEKKTILGDLNKEQKDFIQKKREKEGDGALPPWSGYQEEDIMKQQILALSSDSRNFLRSPPSGVQFNFELDQFLPVAMAVLKEDEGLNKMRFSLVPTKVKEETFWRNYFYRVSLIKQSAQLSTLAALKSTADSMGSGSSSASSIVVVGSTATGTASSRSSSPASTNISNDKMIDDPVEHAIDDDHHEFASDAFDSAALNPDDLEREMRELGMTEGGEVPEWEKELQKELQDYEVVHDGEEKDETWEREIEDMLVSGDKEP